jgi:hypothetical protein
MIAQVGLMMGLAWAAPPVGPESPQWYAGAGLDESLVTVSAGASWGEGEWRGFSELSGAALSPIPPDLGLAVGALWTPHPSLELAGSLPLRFTSNAAFAAVGPALELRARPGWQGERWALRAELGAAWTPFVYVAPTAAYRRHLYEGAEAGWLGSSSLSGRLGVRGAWSVAELGPRRLSVELAGGWLRHSGLDPLIPPLYATVCLSLNPSR